MNQRHICFLLAVIHQPERKCLIIFPCIRIFFFPPERDNKARVGWEGMTKLVVGAVVRVGEQGSVEMGRVDQL